VDRLPSGAGADYWASFADASGSVLRGRLWITAQDPAAGTYRLGVTSKTGSPFAVVAGPEMQVGTTYGIILHHRYSLTQTETRLYLDATSFNDRYTAETSTGGEEMTAWAWLNSTRSPGVLVVDELRVARSFAEVLQPVRDPFGGVPQAGSAWYRHPHLGWYTREVAGQVFHLQAGWLWFYQVPGTAPDLYVYDYTGNDWWFVYPPYFPWIYRYGADAGYYYLHPDSTPTDRILIPAAEYQPA
jgi:hypothetical protein